MENYPVKKKSYSCIILIVLICAVTLLICLSTVYYAFFSHPLLSDRKFWFTPPEGTKKILCDEEGNMGINDDYYNMVLIISVPDKYTGKPSEHIHWLIMPSDSKGAKCYSTFGHIVNVKRRINSFVVIDGCTGQELINHPIQPRGSAEWKKDISNIYFTLKRGHTNILYESCEMYSLQDQYSEITGIIESHDKSDKRMNGFIIDRGVVR